MIGKLVLIQVKHVDDLKVAGEGKEVPLLLKALEEVFGRSGRNNDDFTCVGICHQCKPDGAIILDKNDEYVSTLTRTHDPGAVGKPVDKDCSEITTRLYWSLCARCSRSPG